VKSPTIMHIQESHSWDLSPQQAVELQKQLCGQIICRDKLGSVHIVGGIDVAYLGEGKIACAAVVVISFPELMLKEIALAQKPARLPYIPGLLSFRETPVILDALAKLSTSPDLLICDGHGLAHPRRFGLACHLGLLTGLPSIGVAKSLLVGAHDPVPEAAGSWQLLLDGGEVIGAALRTRTGAKPVFVSIGHCLSLKTAIDFVLRLTAGYRLPEPIRLAHLHASKQSN